MTAKKDQESARGSESLNHETGAPTIQLDAAALAYNGQRLFQDLHLTLPGGRTTCLLGPSGVGKTSLLRLIAGLAAEAEGEARDGAGRPVTDRIAYMAQQDLLLPWASVLDNVLLGLRLRGEPITQARRDQARDLLDSLRVGASAAQRPAQLSIGMRQRVALARTLMEERPIVLMDEPFSALDAITRYELQGLAARRLSGRTLLLVTHDPLEALRLGHEIYVMAGRPARLGQALQPAGAPPRDPADPEILAHQAELLKRLATAHSESEE
ncbi:MAG: ABC transporter ATP-binding protein [Pseudomonadota bacterium]